MEPFRPLVDRAVVDIVNLRGFDIALDRDIKVDLISTLVKQRFVFANEERTLPDWIGQLANSLATVYAGSKRKLFIPEFKYVQKKSRENDAESTPF